MLLRSELAATRKLPKIAKKSGRVYQHVRFILNWGPFSGANQALATNSVCSPPPNKMKFVMEINVNLQSSLSSQNGGPQLLGSGTAVPRFLGVKPLLF